VSARRLLGALGLLIALGAWEAWARSMPSFLFPSASTVLRHAWHVWPTEAFLETVAASLERLAAGFAIGAIVGIGIGLALGASRGARGALEPLVEFLRAIPPVAVVPVAIVVLGLGDGMRIAVIAFGVCFPILVNTADGVRAIPPETRDTSALLHVRGFERLHRLYLPAALPSIVTGLRVALSIGLVMVVISELVGAPDGLGHYIKFQQSQFAVPELYGGILFLGLLGYLLNRLFLIAERRVLAWHYGAVGELGR
jgi:ABC-type nitrate/sulfonate/bicarbonate transport system permease component